MSLGRLLKMSQRSSRFLSFLLVFQCACKNATPCTLTFPELKNSSTFKTEENESVKLSFKISDHNGCHIPDNYSIRVISERSFRAYVKCYIQVRREICYLSAGCTCTGKGTFTLERTVTREDNANWEWLITDQVTDVVITAATINFSVTYPARVITLTLQNPRQPVAQDEQLRVANPGDRVQVKCSVEDGNPPVKARLLDRHGTELQTRKVDGKTDTVDLKYYFPSVSCDHAGIITCAASGSENKTTTLLVRCPPTFEAGDNEIYVTDGDSADLNFNIRSHSRMVTFSLTRLDATEATHDRSSLTVTGSPPDLTVSVRLNNVRKQDQGTRRLTLANDMGLGYIDFQLTVLETRTQSSTTISPPNNDYTSEDSEDPESGNKSLYDLDTVIGIAVAAAASVLLIEFVICYIIICVKKCSQRGGQQVVRQAAPPCANNRDSAECHDYEEVPDNPVEQFPLGSQRGGLQVARQAAPPGADNRDSAERNDYEEVPDNAVEQIPLVAVLPTGRWSPTRDDPVGYLHPTPSSSERINTKHGAST